MKIVKVISNITYFIGVLCVLSLSFVCLFGSNEPINPDAMLPFSWKESAFLWLAFGSIPMLIACVSVYYSNAIKNNVRRKLAIILIFLPGAICTACALYVLVIIALGME